MSIPDFDRLLDQPLERGRYVMRNGELVPKHLAEPLYRPARSALPRPFIATDTVEVVSMVDGKTYTSKAQLRESYRAAGVEEVGNETAALAKMAPPDPLESLPPVETDIKRAIEEVGGL